MKKKKRTARKDGIKSALEKTIPRERLHKRGYIKGVCTRTYVYMHACTVKREREEKGLRIRQAAPSSRVARNPVHPVRLHRGAEGGRESRTRECLLILYREFK